MSDDPAVKAEQRRIDAQADKLLKQHAEQETRMDHEAEALGLNLDKPKKKICPSCFTDLLQKPHRPNCGYNKR